MIQYEKLPQITKEQAEIKLKNAQGEELCYLLLSMCELEDWKWVQDIYLQFVRDKNHWVAAAAITALGHLARIAGKLEKDRVIDILKDISNTRQELKGKAKDAISDINMFV